MDNQGFYDRILFSHLVEGKKLTDAITKINSFGAKIEDSNLQSMSEAEVLSKLQKLGFLTWYETTIANLLSHNQSQNKLDFYQPLVEFQNSLTATSNMLWKNHLSYFTTLAVIGFTIAMLMVNFVTPTYVEFYSTVGISDEKLSFLITTPIMSFIFAGLIAIQLALHIFKKARNKLITPLSKFNQYAKAFIFQQLCAESGWQHVAQILSVNPGFPANEEELVNSLVELPEPLQNQNDFSGVNMTWELSAAVEQMKINIEGSLETFFTKMRTFSIVIYAICISLMLFALYIPIFTMGSIQ